MALAYCTAGRTSLRRRAVTKPCCASLGGVSLSHACWRVVPGEFTPNRSRVSYCLHSLLTCPRLLPLSLSPPTPPPLKGPESEKLKLMYAAYDLSGVAPSEERRKSSATSGNGSSRTLSGIGGGSGGTGGKAKPSRRSKYLSLEDITAVLASASQVAVYPTLLSCTTDGGAITNSYLSGSGTGGGGLNGCCCGSGDSLGETKSAPEEPPRDGEIKPSSSQDSITSGSTSRNSGGSEGGGGGSARTSRDPEALAQLLQEIARRNAAEYAARAVSEFGQAHSGALTQKEFEKWALTGPVLRCRINEFSIDLDLAPFQGVRLA